MPSLADVRTEMLKIWPKGRECEHTYARRAFELLDELEALQAKGGPGVCCYEVAHDVTRLRRRARRLRKRLSGADLEARRQWLAKDKAEDRAKLAELRLEVANRALAEMAGMLGCAAQPQTAGFLDELVGHVHRLMADKAQTTTAEQRFTLMEQMGVLGER